MTPRSFLLCPRTDLAGCVYALILRDTRGSQLAERDRYNHFPASPLVSVSVVIQGTLRLVPQDQDLPRVTVTPPLDKPVTSFSVGPIAAVSLGVYPEAWARLGPSGQSDLTNALLAAFQDFGVGADPKAHWDLFCAKMGPVWTKAREENMAWTGSRRLGDWSRSLIVRAAAGGPGKSIRALERRLKRLSGQTRQALKFYTDFEDLHRLSVQQSETSLAVLAAEAGYADQSHMGRAVKRATGFSPARLNRMIETEESFWCYRLLGQRF